MNKFTKDQILAMVNGVEDFESLVASFANAVNEAQDEMMAQKAEADKKAEARVALSGILREVFDFILEFYPEFIHTDDMAEIETDIDGVSDTCANAICDELDDLLPVVNALTEVLVMPSEKTNEDIIGDVISHLIAGYAPAPEADKNKNKDEDEKPIRIVDIMSDKADNTVGEILRGFLSDLI